MTEINWKKLFPEDEWKEVNIAANTNPGFALILSSSYAILGWIIDDHMSEAVNIWADCQSFLLRLKNESSEQRNKDLYVFVICEEIPREKFRDIEKIINDTHGARKVFLERRGRSIEETMSDTGLAKDVTRFENVSSEISSDLGKILPQDILEDLDKRNEKSILQNLLDGLYKK